MTRRTVRSLMLALRAIVAADGQQPVPSSREHASASASSTSRSLPEAGEFPHTQFITAMLMLAVPALASAPIGGLAQFVSHPPPSGAVRGRTRTSRPPR